MEKRTKIEYNVLNKEEVIIEYEVSDEELALEQEQLRKTEIEKRLQEIKHELEQSDWKSIKYIEGAISEDDFIEHKLHREELRQEYNSLELELNPIEEIVETVEQTIEEIVEQTVIDKLGE